MTKIGRKPFILFDKVLQLINGGVSPIPFKLARFLKTFYYVKNSKRVLKNEPICNIIDMLVKTRCKGV